MADGPGEVAHQQQKVWRELRGRVLGGALKVRDEVDDVVIVARRVLVGSLQTQWFTFH